MDVLATPWGLGRREDDEVVVLDLPYRDVGQLIADTGSLSALTDRARVLRRVPLAEAAASVLPPLPAPGCVWGVGMNYHSKAAATGRQVPDEPILYLSAVSSVIGPGGQVPMPEGCTAQLDGEAEIAVVVGRPLYRADERDVWPALAGITAANDLTARDIMRRTGAPVLAKSFPGCTPLGGSVLPADAVVDASAIGVREWVNGELFQDDTSAGMIWPITDLVARISWFAELRPGDVVLTGTPAGTGQDRDRYLQPGDVVRVEVDGVLPLEVSVVPADSAAPSVPRREGYVPI